MQGFVCIPAIHPSILPPVLCVSGLANVCLLPKLSLSLLSLLKITLPLPHGEVRKLNTAILQRHFVARSKDYIDK